MCRASCWIGMRAGNRLQRKLPIVDVIFAVCAAFGGMVEERYQILLLMKVFSSVTFWCKVKLRIECIHTCCPNLVTRASQLIWTICRTQLAKITPKILTVSTVCNHGTCRGFPLIKPTSTRNRDRRKFVRNPSRTAREMPPRTDRWEIPFEACEGNPLELFQALKPENTYTRKPIFIGISVYPSFVYVLVSFNCVCMCVCQESRSSFNCSFSK